MYITELPCLLVSRYMYMYIVSTGHVRYCTANSQHVHNSTMRAMYKHVHVYIQSFSWKLRFLKLKLVTLLFTSCLPVYVGIGWCVHFLYKHHTNMFALTVYCTCKFCIADCLITISRGYSRCSRVVWNNTSATHRDWYRSSLPCWSGCSNWDCGRDFITACWKSTTAGRSWGCEY